jgi:hypothetical protein
VRAVVVQQPMIATCTSHTLDAIHMRCHPSAADTRVLCLHRFCVPT